MGVRIITVLGFIAVWGLLNNLPADEVINLGIKGRIWATTLRGNVSADERGVKGTLLNFEEDLDIEPNQEAGEVEAYFELLRSHHIHLGYWWVGFRGEEPVKSTFNFAGATYLAGVGEIVSTHLDIKWGTLMYEWIPISPRWGESFKLQVGVQVGGGYLRADTSLEAKNIASPFTQEERIAMPLPIPGLRTRIDIEQWVTLEFQAKGISVREVRDTDLTFIDGLGELQFNLWEGLYLGAGYHLVRLELDFEDGDSRIKFDTSMRGAFVSVGYRF
jgi:hypothetical protein